MNDYLDTVQRQLAELTERGAHRRGSARVGLARHSGPHHAHDGGGGAHGGRPRGDGPGRGPRWRRDALLVVPALLVVVVVVAVMLTIGLGAHHATTAAHRPVTVPTTPAAPPSPSATTTAAATSPTTPASTSPAPATATTAPAGPVPSGFAPESFTAIGTETWWLLGSAPCAGPPCTSIVRTDNGGSSFVGIPAPRTSSVTQLRFANASDGFAYDTELWVTHDAGAQWREVGLGGSVTDLAIGDGYAFAIVRSASGAGRLLRAAVGSDDWTVAPSAGNAFSGLWTHGSEALLESTAGARAQIMVSHDDGAAFAPAGAAPPSVACDLQAPAPPVVWAHCATGMMSATWRSTDDGAQLTAAAGARNPPYGVPQLPNSAAFAAASASAAVVGYQQLYRTADGGTQWTPVAAPARVTQWQYLGFTDPLHGVALGFVGSQAAGHERLYYTTDGGVSYHLVSIG